MGRYLLFTLSLFAFAAGAFAQPLKRQTPQEYISLYQQVAIEDMKKYGIPASITIAQGLFESDMGNSRLARQGNNHFGIKCKKTWTGDTLLVDDDALQECFRSYPTAYDSYDDHSRFLKENPRYAFLFEYASNDYKNWAYGLKKAGYATNPRYPEKLIEIIERYQLHQLDSEIVFPGLVLPPVADQTIAPTPDMTLAQLGKHVEVNSTPAFVARNGDSYSRIAIENDMMVWQVYKYNDLEQDAKPIPGDIVYLKPKKRKANMDNHRVSEGESMWSISQRYGVKLKLLYKKNRMPIGTQPVVGETISVKSTVSAPPKYTYQPPAKRTTPVNPLLPASVTRPAATKPAVTASADGTHTVQAGETLFGISKMYGISVDELKSWNELSVNELKVGSSLKVKAPAVPKPQTPVPAPKPAQEPKPVAPAGDEEAYIPEIHVVQKGETLYSIARKYKMSVADIKTLNKLESNTVSVGMELRMR